jgi:hypothetical protein
MMRRALLLTAALLVLAALAYLRPPGAISGVDNVVVHSLDREYWHHAVIRGRLPLWNPHVGLGRPFAADIQTATFYPPTLVYVLGQPWGAHLSVLFHVLLLAVGMYCFARVVGVTPAAAGAIALVAPFIAPAAVRILLGQMAFADAVCYVPLAFALAIPLQAHVSARKLAALAGVLGLQVMAGHPQVGWITWLGIAFFFTGRRLHDPARDGARWLLRDFAVLAAGIVWGLGMAAVVVVPFAELFAYSNRSVPSVDFAGSFALPRQALGSLFLSASPQVLHMFGPENNLYPGILVTLAGVSGLVTMIGRRREATGFALLIALALLLALGTQTPVFKIGYYVLPGLPGFRFPSRIALLVPFALLILGGLFLSEPAPRGRGRWAPLLVATVGIAAAAWMYARVPRAWGTEWAWLAYRLILAGIGAGLLYLWTVRPAWSKLLAVGMAAVVLADLGDAVRVWRSALSEEPPAGEHAVADALRRPEFVLPGGVPPRVFVPSTVARHNLGMTLGYSTPAAYVAPSLARVWTYVHEGIGVRLPLNNTFPSPEVFARPFPYDTLSLALSYDASTGRLVGREPDPRAYIVPCVETVPTWRDAVRRMAAGHDVHRCTLLEAAPRTTMPRSLAGGQARILSFAPERLLVEVETEGEALLVVGETWFPGWRASVDGREVECRPANAWMRAAVVPGGRHLVTFEYHSRFLIWGALVSGVSLAGALAAWRRRKS